MIKIDDPKVDYPYALTYPPLAENEDPRFSIIYEDRGLLIYHGNCMDVLDSLPDESVDSIVTDPPYGLGFMGKAWDALPPGEIWARECLRVLKPGGHLLSFGGTRTWHRIAVAVEDAGFEIRDSIAWMYGSGFPKSMDVSKALDKAAGAEREVVGRYQPPGMDKPWNLGNAADERDVKVFASSRNNLDVTAPATDAAKQWAGWGTALKPAFEPIVVARKPIIGTVVNNVLTYGTGAINIDACRIGTETRVNQAAGNKPGGSSLMMSVVGMPDNVEPRKANGRWPANVILDENQAAALDEQSGIQKSGVAVQRNGGGQSIFGGISDGTNMVGARLDAGYGDVVGASRFFYCAKASTKERPRINDVAHPTAKPLTLMRYLIKLVTPPNGVVLDPFLGSGTTAEAALLEGFRCVGIERESDYIPLIMERINRAKG